MVYKCAVVGMGRGKSHINSVLSYKGAEIAALCDINEDLAKSRAKKVEEKQGKDCPVYTDYDKMLDDADLDAVFIATPHYLHAPMAIKAAQHEIHVFVEKPMAMNLHECDKMIIECRKMDVKLAVGMQHHFEPEFKYMKDAVAGKEGDKGSLGQITDIYMVARHHRGEMYYLASSPVDPDTGVDAGPWRGRWDTEGGGPLPNQAIHNLDLFRYITGPLRSLTAYGKNLSPEHKFVEVEDTIVASMEMENGGLANLLITTSNMKTEEPNKITIHGTKGCIMAEGGYGGRNILVDTRYESQEDFEVPFVMEMEKRDQIHNFFWAIDNDEDPFVTGEEARKSIELMRAILKSIMVEGPVRFPLVDMRERPFIHNVSREQNLTFDF